MPVHMIQYDALQPLTDQEPALRTRTAPDRLGQGFVSNPFVELGDNTELDDEYKPEQIGDTDSDSLDLEVDNEDNKEDQLRLSSLIQDIKLESKTTKQLRLDFSRLNRGQQEE